MRIFLLATVSKSKTDDMNSPETDFILEQKQKTKYFSGTVSNAKIILTHALSSRCSRQGGDGPAGKLSCRLFGLGVLSCFYPGFQRFFVLEWKTCTVGTVPWGMGLVNEN